MAKILDFFKNRKPVDLSTVRAISAELTPGIINISEHLRFHDVGNRLYNALIPHVNFEEWHFIPEFFDVRTTKFRYAAGEMTSDIQSKGVVVTVLKNLKTKELKFFEVEPLIPELFTKR